jgi:hypothetical protein
MSKKYNMLASYRDGDFVIKAYDNGDDWQLLDNKGNERWFSVWSGNRHESLTRGFKNLVEFNGFYFDQNKFSHFKLDY